MIPPIIVEEYGNLMFFKSAADAERYLEPIDVRNGEYVAYDSVGRRLTLGVAKKESKFFYGMLKDTMEVVTVRDGNGVDAADELSQILRKFLERFGRTRKSTEGVALAALIEQTIQHVEYCV
jgi:hypothetical protein